ncbi:MAG: hypothetical protein ACI4HI_05030 [Lachnospiraceae bacterium]
MTADELRAALEAELAWRQQEIAFFKNQLNEIAEENRDKYRKALVLISWKRWMILKKKNYILMIR